MKRGATGDANKPSSSVALWSAQSGVTSTFTACGHCIRNTIPIKVDGDYLVSKIGC